MECTDECGTFRHFLKCVFSIWQNFEQTLAKNIILGKFFIAVIGQILHNCLASWSHWTQNSPTKSDMTDLTMLTLGPSSESSFLRKTTKGISTLTSLRTLSSVYQTRRWDQLHKTNIWLHLPTQRLIKAIIQILYLKSLQLTSKVQPHSVFQIMLKKLTS